MASLTYVDSNVLIHYPEQVAFFLNFFRAAQFIPSSDALIEEAQALAATYDLSPMDALHIACAKSGNAAEFITFEKPTKPFFNIPPEELRVVSLY
jgi:predicted nucleic acid-binding protein